jgi:basic amino acid/polyamine antiporter, APA family
MAGLTARTRSRSLTQAIGRLALTALVLNAVIGSSVFGLPSVVAAKLGAASPLAWLLAAVGMALIVGCFAEMASRFSEAGGQYLYARVAFGRLAGIEMAWLTYLVRLTAAATNANLFVIYLAEFWPGATGPLQSRIVLGAMLLPLAIANYRGVGSGLNVSNTFTIAKLVPLGVFVVGGLGVLVSRGLPGPMHPSGAVGLGGWLQVILVLVFAYGGFEAALLPLGEAKNPRRDAPIALFAALGVCALLYTLVQAVVVATLEDPGATERPLAAAARTFLGPGGATLMALGALVSVYGYLAGAMLNVPRLSYAMAEQGDLPPRFGAVHPRYRTPHVSVLLFAILTWALASVGSFLQNLSLSAVSRLLTYGAVCVALIVLRRRERREAGRVEPAWFRLPLGETVATLGLAFSTVLILRMNQRELAVLAATLIVGLMHWRAAARPSPPEEGPGS